MSSCDDSSITNRKATALRTTSTSSSQSATTQLTDHEVNHLVEVMQRAQKFDEEEISQRKAYIGQLYKYTNVVKGWQHRWFLINQQTKSLEYFMNDEDLANRTVRGSVPLAGMQVHPSDEDSRTFTVVAMNESYKLKAPDVKTRQLWVDHLRLAALHHEQVGDLSVMSVNGGGGGGGSGAPAASNDSLPIVPLELQANCDLGKSSLQHVARQLHLTQMKKTEVVEAIEEMTNKDVELLSLKANASATLLALEQCFYILKALKTQ